jgi:hypothetical protein
MDRHSLQNINYPQPTGPYLLGAFGTFLRYNHRA